MSGIRKKDFKIGCFHGKLNPNEKSMEARMRNYLYLIGMLRVNQNRSKTINIRLIAYEMPLMDGQSRGKCVDLFGYDQNKRPWIVELKKEDSSENINEVIGQICKYSKILDKDDIRKAIEKEIAEKYHWDNFMFSPGVGKILLAPRKYFKGKSLTICSEMQIMCCAFAWIQSGEKQMKLLAGCGSAGVVNLRVENKRDL